MRSRGALVCGVSGEIAGFSLPDSRSVMQGMDADYCRAIAAAVLGDAGKVRFVNLSAQNRFPALQSGEIDVLIRQTTLTMTRDTTLGLRMVAVNLYDGHGFMVRRDSGVKAPLALADVTSTVPALLETIQADMFQRAKDTNATRYKEVTKWEDLVPTLDAKNVAVIPWCEVEACEDDIKERSANA